MSLPDFVVIGAMKAATSTICGYLEHHPEAYMVPRSDPNFFSRDDIWAKGTGWYEGLFAPRTTEAVAGEGSNGYTAAMLYPQAAERMHAVCPDARLVYIVRHPIERIVSAWIQYRQNNAKDISTDIDRAVRDHPERFLDQSLYWAQLQRYRAYWSDERIFVGFMEDLMADEASVLRPLCDFLGIDPEIRPAVTHANPSAGKEVLGAGYARVSRLPGVAGVSRLLPETLKRSVKRKLFTTRIDARPALSPRVRAELVEALRPDAQALLGYAGKPVDYWAF